MKLAELVPQTSWPPKRDKMRYDADWVLYIRDKWRVVMKGVPSVFE
jgi:hypothetical protein